MDPKKTLSAFAACTVLGASTAGQITSSPAASDPAPTKRVWADLDGDGRQDLYVTRIGLPDSAYLNRGDGSFDEAPPALGLAGRGSRAVHVLDVDRDGAPELLLVDQRGQTSLLTRVDGAFVDVTAEHELQAKAGIRRAEVLDYDEDGWLDLYLESKSGGSRVLHNEGGRLQSALDLAGPPASEDNRALASADGSGSEVTATSAADAANTNAQPDRDGPPGPGAPNGPSGPANQRVPIDISLSGPGSTLVAPPDPTTGSAEEIQGPGCAQALADAAVGGNCLQASSVPAVGRLYPLSQDLFVSTAGRVGLGLTNPLYDLDVAGRAQIRGNIGSPFALKGVGSANPTWGYFGVQGQNNFDTIASADWAGLSIGAAGISTGSGPADNFGVMGHSTGAGVRGENATSPNTNYAELGLSGIGLVASGTSLSAQLHGNASLVDSSGDQKVLLEPLDVGGGQMRLFNDSGRRTLVVDGDSGGTGAGQILVADSGGQDRFFLTTASGGAEILLEAADGNDSVFLDGSGQSGGGAVAVRSDGGVSTVKLIGDGGSGGLIEMLNDSGRETVEIDSDSGGGALMALRNGAGQSRVTLDGDVGDAGFVTLFAADGSTTIALDGDDGNGGGDLSVRNDVSEITVTLSGDNGGDSGRISLSDRNGSNNFEGVVLSARDAFGTGAELQLTNNTGAVVFDVDGGSTTGTLLQMKEPDGSTEFQFLGNIMTLYNSAGVPQISMDGNTGAKNAVVTTQNYGQRLFYCMESPEVWFEDFGSAQLQGGSARIQLDSVFLESVTINADHPLKVFVTLNGPNDGYYVEKGTDGFTLHVEEGGQASFDWRVVAKRKGLESTRLAPFVEANLESDPESGPSASPRPAPVRDELDPQSLGG